MKPKDSKKTYLRAKNRLDRLKGFYSHLGVYVLVNTAITGFKIARNIKNGETFHDAFFDMGTFFIWGLWGIGLAIHTLAVFGFPLLLGKDWEEKKINEFMEQERENKHL